jgi:ribonuclease-3
MPDLSQLSARLGYEFTNVSLLETALLHRSWKVENQGGESNERLEFLGDAVLGWVVADIVYTQHSDLPEGKLTDLRKSVVNGISLAELAIELEIDKFLIIGKREEVVGIRKQTNILSDALEAVFGAIYLDGGPVRAKEIISALMELPIIEALKNLGRLDPKTRLQEIGSRLNEKVRYVVTGEGPAHDTLFSATVFVGDRELGYGEGKSKKAAEQIAAEIACDVLNSELPA